MIANMDFGYFKYISGKENLSEIFEYELNTFDNVRCPHVTGNISLYDLLMQIKYNFLNGLSIEQYLTPKYTNGNKNDAFRKIKESIRTVCYNATFNGYKDEYNLIAPTNLMFLDIDGFKSKDETLKYKEMIISKYDWIVSCNLSFSRVGLHIIILVDKITDIEDFNNKYDFINTVYFYSKLDSNAKSVTRHTIISSDINIYINESPTVLPIDSIISKTNKDYHNNKPELNSKSNTGKSIGGGNKKREVISTAYTFSPKDLQSITNISAREDGLVYEEVFDEDKFSNPNIPLYFPEGVKVMEINLYPFKYKKVLEGNRNNTIGGISVRLIYLSTNKLQDKPDYKKKSDILKYMLKLNMQICDPPLTDQEVINSVTSNWNRYVEGKLDTSRLFTIKRFFWSKHSTLTPNEKRSVTYKIKNEPVVANSRKLISDAIEKIHTAGEKITQEKVVAVYKGMADHKIGIATVKNYWSEYKSLVKELNLKLI